MTCGRPAQLSISLGRIIGSSERPEVLVVVDNLPSRETEGLVDDAAERSRLDIRYVAAAANLGPARARNVGVANLPPDAGDEDWVAFFDDDEHLPSPEVLGALAVAGREARVKDPAIGGVALAGARFRVRLAYTAGVAAANAEEVADSLHGWAFPLYRLGPYRSVGGFDGDLFFGFEELELGLRLRDAGHRLLVAGILADRFGVKRIAAERVHLGVDRPRWQRYYSLRNLIVLLRRRGHRLTAIRVALVRGLAKPLANLPLRPRSSLHHLRMNARAVRDGFGDRLGRRLEPDTRGLAWDRPGRAAGRFRVHEGWDASESAPADAPPSVLIDRFLSGMIDEGILTRRLVAGGVSPDVAIDHARILAPRVTRPTPRWGVGQRFDGGDLYAEESEPQQPAREVPEPR